MRTTIAHGKSRYQQKDSTLWGLASTWEMRLTGPIPRPERTLTAEEVFAKWLERQAASQAKDKPDPVAVKIVEALAGLENDPKFNLGNHGYTMRRTKGKGASGFIAYKNEKAK